MIQPKKKYMLLIFKGMGGNRSKRKKKDELNKRVKVETEERIQLRSRKERGERTRCLKAQNVFILKIRFC